MALDIIWTRIFASFSLPLHEEYWSGEVGEEGYSLNLAQPIELAHRVQSFAFFSFSPFFLLR